MAATSLTFKELQDLVFDQLQEIAGATDFTLTKLKKYINMGYKDFTRRTLALTGKLDITTVADQESYSLVSAQFIKIGHVRYIEDSSTEYGRALRPFPGGFANLPRQKSFGSPERYWIRYSGDNTAVEIGTVPIASTANETIRVFGYKLPASLSADNDIPLIHESWHEALILYSVWKICNAYAHKGRAIQFKARTARDEYLEMIAMASRELSSATADEPPETIDVYGGHNSFEFF